MNKSMNLTGFWVVIAITILHSCTPVRMVKVGLGWAGNSVNAVVFRKNALVSDHKYQFTAYYDTAGRVVLAKRALGQQSWQTEVTPYTGNIQDAHNSISIMLDEQGYLHMAWNHHNNPLNYVRSKEPYSLLLGPKIPMTGKNERRVTYPEFHKLPGGQLLFFYRDGSSGNGNLVLNRYDTQYQRWQQLHANLINGEGKRNAYWQSCVDTAGVVYLSWVWRESPDVASNHDLCFAKSTDGGQSWQKSTGETYTLPIDAGNAETLAYIPQGSTLINQTSMAALANGTVAIATYYADNRGVPQYRVHTLSQGRWQHDNSGFRSLAFTFGGVGTRQIPISRPQILLYNHKHKATPILVFRDEERGSNVSVAFKEKGIWKVQDLTDFSVGDWEPSYDTEMWKRKQQLHLYVQKVTQVSGEGIAAAKAEPVIVLEWKPSW